MAFRWWMAVPIILIAYCIGVFNMYDGIVSQAEVNSLRHIGLHQQETNSIPQIIDSIIMLSPQHAPLYFISLKYWTEAFGTDPGLQRLLSIFWGVLTVAMVYRLGVTLVGKQGGWYASLFVISSWAFMYYIHEIRQYVFLMFVSSTLIWIYWKLITYKGRVPLVYWVGLYVFSTLSVYIHYFGILSLIAIGFYHLFFVHKDRRWMGVGVVEALAGLTFLPWLSIMLAGMQTMPDLSDRILSPVDVIYQIFFFHSNGLLLVLMALVLLVVWHYRQLSRSQRFALIMLLVMIGSIFVIHQLRPILFFGRLRYITIFLPMFAIVVGMSFTLFGRFQRFVIVIALSLLASGFIFVRSDLLYDYAGLDRTPPYDEILEYIDTLPGLDEPLISLSALEDNAVVSLQVREYYNKLTGRRIYHFFDTDTSDRYTETYDKIAEDYAGFWLLYWSNTVKLAEMTMYTNIILKDFQNCRVFIDQDNLKLFFMARQDLSCELVTRDTPLVVYDNDVILSNVWSEVRDDTLHAYIWWQDIPSEEYGVSLQIFDETGNKVAQDDFVIVDSLHHRQIPWSDIPEGNYDIQMILYNLDDTASIGGHLSSGSHFDRSFSVGTVLVQ